MSASEQHAPERYAREALVALGCAVLCFATYAASPADAGAKASAADRSPAPALGALPPGAERQSSPGLRDDAESGCSFTDRGFGDYGGWRSLPLGKLLVPIGRGVTEDGRYDLLIHFHGAEPMRKELAPAGLDLVLVGVDLGARSGVYEQALSAEGAFGALLASIDQAVARAVERPHARARSVIVSSWSAGYGAVTGILARPRDNVRAIVLLDSLYASYPGGKRQLEKGQLPAFTRAAREAADGGPFFLMTSTDVPTQGYASTAEVADFLVHEVGLTPELVPIDPGESSPLVWSAERRNFVARHFGGNSREAHCDALRQLAPLLRERVMPSLAW